jgi:hypothetical protein
MDHVVDCRLQVRAVFVGGSYPLAVYRDRDDEDARRWAERQHKRARGRLWVRVLKGGRLRLALPFPRLWREFRFT